MEFPGSPVSSGPVEHQQGRSGCARAAVFPLALLLYVSAGDEKAHACFWSKEDDRQEEEKCAALVTLAKPILVSPIPRHFAKPSQGKGATWRTSKVIWQ